MNLVFAGAFWLGVIANVSGPDRPLVRISTREALKWNKRHNAGCTLYAPDYVCICREFKPRPPLR